MKPDVLGIVGSHRRRGNTELLVTEALTAAAENGAAVEMVRLADLDIRACQGCMSCVLKGTACRVRDDVPRLLDRMKAADGVVIGAPTYVLSPAAPVKQVLDRFLSVSRDIEELRRRRRHGISISVAGLEGWNPFGTSFLNVFLLAFQFDVVGSMAAYGPGPGEVLLDDRNTDRARTLGRLLVDTLRGGPVEEAGAVPVGEDRLAGRRCPVCGNGSFELGEGGQVTCPLCLARGRIVSLSPLVVDFEPDVVATNRWAMGPMIHHIDDWVIASGARFREVWPRIKPLLGDRPQLEARRLTALAEGELRTGTDSGRNT